MKKLTYLLTALVMFSAIGVVNADDDGIGIDLSTSWVSKYIWRGVDVLDDKAAFQPSVNFDLGSGFSFNVWASYAGASKNGGSVSTVDATEYNYRLTYANSIWDDSTVKTNYALSWIYYDFIDQPDKNADAQEVNLSLSWPEICPFGTVPSYTIVRMWSAESEGPSNGLSGWIHVIGLTKDFTVPGLLDDTTDQTLRFGWDITYNDGAGVPGLPSGTVDSDWSHMTWSLAAPMTCGQGTLTPAVYYQTSMEDTVNKEDEFWTGITYSFAF